MVRPRPDCEGQGRGAAWRSGRVPRREPTGSPGPGRREGGTPMKRPENRWFRRLLVLLIVPPALWAAVLALVPTEWAKARVLARLRQETGRSVHLGALRLGLLGGVRLEDLEVGEPEPNAPPWLRVETLRV